MEPLKPEPGKSNQNRPLSAAYPVLYIDAIHYSVRDNGIIRKLAAYVVLGINSDGRKKL